MNKAQIYRIVRNSQQPDGSSTPIDGYSGLVHGPRFAANIADIKGVVRILNNFQDIDHDNNIRSQQILRVDSGFLTTFSFPLIAGNPATALTQPHTIVITEDMARREFGTADALGKTLLVKTRLPARPGAAQPGTAQPPATAADAFQPYTVTGVARNCPANSSIKFEALTPIDVASTNFVEYNNNWDAIFLNSFLVLAPGADVRAVEARMARVYATEAKDQIAAGVKIPNYRPTQWLLQPLSATHLSTDYAPIDGLVDASKPVFSYILSGIAARPS